MDQTWNTESRSQNVLLEFSFPWQQRNIFISHANLLSLRNFFIKRFTLLVCIQNWKHRLNFCFIVSLWVLTLSYIATRIRCGFLIFTLNVKYWLHSSYPLYLYNSYLKLTNHSTANTFYSLVENNWTVYNNQNKWFFNLARAISIALIQLVLIKIQCIRSKVVSIELRHE